MVKMFSAKAVARTRAELTLASAVLAGPVLKKRKNTAQKTALQAHGKGSLSMASVAGKAKIMALPETRKYAPLKRGRSFSATKEPSSVEKIPATTTMMPNVVFTSSR